MACAHVRRALNVPVQGRRVQAQNDQIRRFRRACMAMPEYWKIG
jgi:hypothetical protein